MRPGWIEVHVDRQRTREPDSESGEERPSLGKIFSCEKKREPDGQKSVERGAERHRHHVWPGEPVGRDLSAERVIGKNREVSSDQERRPENCWTDREMIVEMACNGVLLGQDVATRVKSSHPE